ncbi:MAG: 1-deoxy-D-xylulose-5-phosphate reductoisomerase [Acidimicrobiia bacterium]|nr:1-deoxy-D-xylulose-5-phosphate reductoisomerase [Acidimicrobiia bacterium]MYC57275.1 1-deoxy-D-xylulose-5-phosphate reductoisomerase [Acidimicrobiia bacterium]MYG94479.1 1-deoxy-D-xylulose-5-phosphate reductoisomerase [Acidimicrobiia bacterium]MYI30935.1 1-deoxy-D-xylulose-5-phosphate reductoisomerase [Acidimicrobiia bacterium]
MKSLSLLGSTGSIGIQTLEVLRAEPESWDVVALGVGRSASKLLEQAREFQPQMVVVADPEMVSELQADLPGIQVASGSEALVEAAAMGEVVVNAVVGFAGLPVTLAALEAGRRLALANKESLIAAGPLVQRARQTFGAELLPVDSEHCAIHQCLRANSRADIDHFNTDVNTDTDVNTERVARIVLTASGGPFRGCTTEELATVTVQSALSHPTWEMGAKITVDSSTLMNKGLEVIEANELFGVDFERIEVVVHPQSVVHSMVEYTDGATVAQLSMPDMRLCIGYALAYPDRITTPFGQINWQTLGRLEFESPNTELFPCLELAYEAGRLGGTAPALLNAANEVAVQAFLDEQIRWMEIPHVLQDVLDSYDGTAADSLGAVMQVDRQARMQAERIVTTMSAS